MKGQILAGAVTAAIAASALSAPVLADTAIAMTGVSGGGEIALPPYLQCVPYARQVSGIQIYGDAHTWWGQAAGQYERGYRPRVGAVMTFKPYGNMRLGHVAAVSRIIDSRTVLIRHSNWSPINGRRGQIEDNVRAIDVSPDNDWSEVRVWFDPIQALGGTHWPVQGFIYNRPAAKRLDEGTVLARASRLPEDARIQRASSEKRGGTAKVELASATQRVEGPQFRSADPIGEIIASRSRRSTLAIRD
jgi:surface antigen